MVPVKGCQSILEVDVLEAEKMGKSKDLNNFDKGQVLWGVPSMQWLQ